MSMSGVLCNPSKLLFLLAKRSCLLQPQVSAVHYNGNLRAKMKSDFGMNRNYWSSTTCGNRFRKTHKIQNAIDASFGDISDDSNGTAVFPRINVRDPYKRLGISREASEEEIQAARNFLINKYAGHKPSVDAIESAHDKIIMQSFYEKKNPRINIKKKIREVSQSRIVTALTSRFEAPSTKFIIKTSIAFVVLGTLTILFPTDEGPTLQVAISLIASIYFIYNRLKNRIRAFLYGVGAFIFSWLLGTFLMVSVIPPILKGPRSLEVTTSLITFLLLWVSSTYLK
ncbi:protein CHAPERONE-LIKE PROTEIN OF POR1, chloroplastic-like [Aristolochia californica]|uniref:protein CHAPERONE-LIKE PROTEIN OF POR1, chloroplastic-like n=1 Tax=Aristolochia californica TaxID=171875 RepID=UPI0035DA401D